MRLRVSLCISSSRGLSGSRRMGSTELQRMNALGYIDELYRYAMVLVRNRTEAEDLVQETYVRALKAMGSLRPDSNIKAWLFTILRNVWRNQLRRRRASPDLVEIDADEANANVVVEPSPDPHAVYVSDMESNYVREAIAQLPSDFREVIVLREFEDLSYQEIADLLKCPTGTVMSRLGRARSKLRALLSSTLQTPSVHETGRAQK